MTLDKSELKKPNLDFVWHITDYVLRDLFKKSEIGDVILPFVVLRRLDCILEPVNEKVRTTYNNFVDKVAADKLDPILKKAAGGLKFYNVSRFTLTSLCDDPRNIDINFVTYINGFNKEVASIMENFQLDKIVARLNSANQLFMMIEQISALDFSLEKIDNHDMGYIFEELLRIANEQSNETAGEHFTPRDVIRLMSAVLFTPDQEKLNRKGIIRTIFDPACGTGGMLNVGRNYILEEICKDGNKITINTFGQELNPQSFAIAKSEALVTGENADNIRLGNSFDNDQFKGRFFDYIMANPPYGVTWKNVYNFVINESLNPDGRFSAGTPRTSDGQLLFIQHMLSKMERDGSRVGIVTNGSPLFSGGIGSGESSIRKWIIENDWLDCIIALPKDLFYNTGIATYIWILTNAKAEHRRGKIQLLNAVDLCLPAKKSLGNKRNDITETDIQTVLKEYLNFEESDISRIYPNSFFGAYQITIEQPLRDSAGKIKLKKGTKQPDTSKRDTAKVSLTSDVNKFFEDEVLPHIDPEAWIDLSKTRIGYEINFTRYFHKMEERRSVDEIEQSLKEREPRIIELFNALFK